MQMLDSGDVEDHPYKLQFDTFFESIHNDIEMPLTGLKEAVKAHEIIFAADTSAATGKSIKVSSI